MSKLLTYKVIREDPVTGKQGKRSKRCQRWEEEPLRIGGLYYGLGDGFPGFQRVISLIKTERIGE